MSAPAATTPVTGATAAGPSSPRRLSPPARDRLVRVGLVAVLLIPVVAALVALHSPRWYPLNDLAQTEMRLRDVGTRHPPLIGLIGRMQDDGVQGSHPGPLGYYVMWPVYWLLGGGSWAMLAASAWIHAVAVAASIWMAARRGGTRLALLVAVALAVLTSAYGAAILTVAWNPYLPLLWWIAFLLALWSVLDDDVLLLPMAVFAWALCAQTHIGYLGTTTALLAGAVVWSFVRARRRTAAGEDAALRTWSRVALASAVLAAVLWLPPVIDLLTTSPSNAAITWRYLLHPDESPLGLGRGLRVLLVHLDPWRLVTGDIVRELGAPGEAAQGTVDAGIWPGVLLLGTWAAAVGAAWRLRHRSLLLLHGLLAATLVVGVVNLSRLFGLVWYYLVLWAWGVTALLLVAIVATAAVVVRERLPARGRANALGVGTVGLAGALLLSSAAFAADVGPTEVSEPWATRALDAVVPPTAAALDRRDLDGPFLVEWGDPMYLGSQGWALANELHREGFDVGTDGIYHGGAMRYRRVRTARRRGGDPPLDRRRHRRVAAEPGRRGGGLLRPAGASSRTPSSTGCAGRWSPVWRRSARRATSSCSTPT